MLSGPAIAVSNLATWRERVELIDAEDETPIDLETDVEEITVTIRDPSSEETLLTATLSGGDITLPPEETEGGVFEFVFTAEQMSTLDPQTYDIGCLVKMTDDAGGDTEQIILGTLPVLKGL